MYIHCCFLNNDIKWRYSLRINFRENCRDISNYEMSVITWKLLKKEKKNAFVLLFTLLKCYPKKKKFHKIARVETRKLLSMDQHIRRKWNADIRKTTTLKLKARFRSNLENRLLSIRWQTLRNEINKYVLSSLL